MLCPILNAECRNDCAFCVNGKCAIGNLAYLLDKLETLEENSRLLRVHQDELINVVNSSKLIQSDILAILKSIKNA